MSVARKIFEEKEDHFGEQKNFWIFGKFLLLNFFLYYYVQDDSFTFNDTRVTHGMEKIISRNYVPATPSMAYDSRKKCITFLKPDQESFFFVFLTRSSEMFL